MSTDRPERLTDRITELWTDRPRADRPKEPLSPDRPRTELSFDRPPADIPLADRISDHPADKFPNREFARFRDLEPLTPASAPSVPASPIFSPPQAATSTTSPSPAPGPTPAPSRVRPWAPQPAEPTPRAVGSPLPTGTSLTAPPSSPSSSGGSAQPAPSPTSSPTQPGKNLALGRGLPPAEAQSMELPTSVQRVVNAVRASLPFIQRILPLLDGNIGTAVSNLMAPPAPIHRPAPPPPPPVDLAPLEEGISTLQTQHRELRSQIADQNTSLKRVEDQLEMVREATDRNTLEQQELLEDLKNVGNKVNIFAMVALLLLVVSVMVNVILYLHIQRVLP